MKRIVSGIQPSGTPHLGNYFGMIQPSLRLAEREDAIYFIADYHALTTVKDPAILRELTFDVAATWMALGLDPTRTVLYVQSDVPEVCELAWILSCVVAKGLLNRSHAYKAVVDANQSNRRSLDDGVTVGLFNYPILMAADILIHGAELVPVGQDQQQHIEIARDVAQAFNTAYGETFIVPEGVTDSAVATVPGTDGRKMSKSYDNVVPIFADDTEVAQRIMSIVTDSRRADEPKSPESCNVFALYSHVAHPEDVAAMAARYTAGQIGYREAKEALLDAHRNRFGSATAEFRELRADPSLLHQVLVQGADQARTTASEHLKAARDAVGIGALTRR